MPPSSASPLDLLRDRPTPGELALMQTHTTHGTGYPRGLAGEAIPLAARIAAVADVVDALGHDRPYRPAWPPDRVAAHARAGAGAHFDPAVVAALPRAQGSAEVAGGP